MTDHVARAITERLDMLERSVGGPTIVVTAASRFLDGLDALVDGVLSADDDDTRARTAHELKGSAAALGATHLADVAGDVEAAPHELDPAVFVAAAVETREVLERYVAATKR